MRRYKIRQTRTERTVNGPAWAVYSPDGIFRMNFYNWENALYWANKWHEREHVHALNRAL